MAREFASELTGYEMKNPADKRSKMNRRMLENENANMRAKLLLTEFMNPEFGIENVRSYSPSQQELLRIYEDGAISNAGSEIDDEISDIMNRLSQVDVKKQPTASEVKRYILWLEQNYRSPYTGQMIPLAKLFTPAYEIEHVIPQSRYFADSFSNGRHRGNSLSRGIRAPCGISIQEQQSEDAQAPHGRHS